MRNTQLSIAMSNTPSVAYIPDTKTRFFYMCVSSLAEQLSLSTLRAGADARPKGRPSLTSVLNFSFPDYTIFSLSSFVGHCVKRAA